MSSAKDKLKHSKCWFTKC